MSPAGRGPAGRGRTTPRRWLAAVPPLLVLVEVVGILLVGQALGAGWTLLLLLAGVVGGGVVLVRGGVGGARRAAEHARSQAATATTPADLHSPAAARELADAGLVALGAVLLMAPGFLSDLVGLVALFPPTRPLVRRLLGAAAGAAALRVVGVRRRRDGVVPGSVVVDPDRPDASGRGDAGGGGPLEGRVLPPGEDPPGR